MTNKFSGRNITRDSFHRLFGMASPSPALDASPGLGRLSDKLLALARTHGAPQSSPSIRAIDEAHMVATCVLGSPTPPLRVYSVAHSCVWSGGYMTRLSDVLLNWSPGP